MQHSNGLNEWQSFWTLVEAKVQLSSRGLIMLYSSGTTGDNPKYIDLMKTGKSLVLTTKDHEAVFDCITLTAVATDKLCIELSHKNKIYGTLNLIVPPLPV